MILKYGEHNGKPVGLPVTAVPGSSLLAPVAADTANPMDAMSGGTGAAKPVPVASVAADPDSRGGLSFIDNAVDTTTATVMLKATFSNRDGTLWSGQFVATTLRLFTEDGVLVLPTQAVVTGQQGTYVYVIDSSNTARQRPVTVERAAGAISVISTGVSEGDRVVTDGQARVTPGAQVTVGLHDNSSGGGTGAGGTASGGRGGRGRGGRGKAAKADTAAGKPAR
jgi:multidrug efflux system membrane fusion protein